MLQGQGAVPTRTRTSRASIAIGSETKTITAYAEFVPRGDTFYTDAWAPAVPPADIAVLPG